MIFEGGIGVMDRKKLLSNMIVLMSFIAVFFVFQSETIAANAGYVAYIDDRQTVIVVETDYDTYTCAEIYYGGYLLEPGMRVFGPMTTYGIQTWKYKDGEITVFVDEMFASGDSAFEWLRRH